MNAKIMSRLVFAIQLNFMHRKLTVDTNIYISHSMNINKDLPQIIMQWRENMLSQKDEILSYKDVKGIDTSK